MKKNLFVGGGLGLVVLAFLAGIWFGSASVDSSSEQPSSTVLAASYALNPPVSESFTSPPSSVSVPLVEPVLPGAAAPVTRTLTGPLQEALSDLPFPSGSTPESSEPMSKEERRKIRTAVRAKMAELLAKGTSATLEDTQKLMDDVQALGQGQFDTRYFATMRKIIEYSARAQVLNKELIQLTAQKTPEADARKTVILVEIRDLADRINNGAQALHSYSQDALSGKQP